MSDNSRKPWEERVRRFGVDPNKLDGRPFQLTTKSLQEFKSWFAIPEGKHTVAAKISLDEVGDALTPRTRRWIINHIIGLERIEDAGVIAAIERVAGPFHCMVHAARERFVTAQDPVVAHQHYSVAEFERLVIARKLPSRSISSTSASASRCGTSRCRRSASTIWLPIVCKSAALAVQTRARTTS